MSRIIRGSSEDVKGMRLTSPTATARQEKAFVAPQFKMFQSEGTYTQAELELEIQKAIQKTKLEAARETEQKLKTPLMNSLENLNNVLDELSRFRRELFKESESEILTLVKIFAKHVLGREIQQDPSVLEKLIQQATELLNKEHKVEIRLNPKDIQNFNSAQSEVLKPRDGVRIIPDQQVQPGQAAIDSSHKSIEVNMEKIVEDIFSNIMEQKSEIKETGDEGDKV